MRESANRRTSEIFLLWVSAQIYSMSDVRKRLPLRVHGRSQYNGYWEANNQEVCNNITRAHSNELNVALPAFRSWIWNYLPVVAERLAF